MHMKQLKNLLLNAQIDLAHELWTGILHPN